MEVTLIDKDHRDYLFDGDILERGSLILIDKPIKWTSFDVIRYIRKNIYKVKMGHTGTLDPLATGLLPICTGKATKKASVWSCLPKSYIAVIQFGLLSPSLDMATPPEENKPWEHITYSQCQQVIRSSFNGSIEQEVPLFSAVKYQGRPLYWYAHRNKKAPCPIKTVTIYSIDIKRFDLPYVSLFIRCSSGTYIRSLVRDLGFALNSCALLYRLVRVEVGEFNIADSLNLEQCRV